MKFITLLFLVWKVHADLRLAARPREGYKIRNEQGAIPFVSGANAAIFTEYMEPSTFEYQGLENQKRKNYDQFLRSNIDNEQDNRNFDENEGKDHLPFRSFHTRVATQEGPSQLTQTVAAGGSLLVPLRWNNPHSAELEANIWITSVEPPVVVPIKKPTCSGEGYQDNIFEFTIPADFKDLGAKIPGFTGCNQDMLRRCVLQVYAHSVESRTYAIGIPIVITGHDALKTTATWNAVQPASQDPGMDLTSLRRFCLPSDNKVEADIPNAVPRYAKLFSDVYDHAYMNSDFSPYQGQQHESISQNLQASAINKMVTGNRGELGKAAIPTAMAQKIKQLQNLENKVYKAYESIANKIIKAIGEQKIKETGTVSAGGSTQQLANCFRCATVGSTNTKRLQTNTYIPSFELPAGLVADAQKLIPQKYQNLIEVDTATGIGYVQIYKTAMNDLAKTFLDAAPLGIVYQMGVTKNTLDTKPDAVQFKKRSQNNEKDNGVYAYTQALIVKAAEIGCAENCLKANSGNAPLLKSSTATRVTGTCSPCEQFFKSASQPTQVAVTPIASVLIGGDALPDIGGAAVPDYPDADGSPRIGRPADPSTTTAVSYIAPQPIGVSVGAAAPDCLHGHVIMFVLIVSTAFSIL